MDIEYQYDFVFNFPYTEGSLRKGTPFPSLEDAQGQELEKGQRGKATEGQ